MAFSIEKYAKAMDDFVIKMEYAAENQQNSIVCDALAPICEVLRIAYVSVKIYEGVLSQIDEREITLFEAGEYDVNQKHCYHESIGGNVEIEYCFYQGKDAEPWTEEEEKRVKVLTKLLASFTGKGPENNAYNSCTSSNNSYIFWDEDMLQKHEETKKIEQQFRSAIENEEFLVYYQPKVGLKNYRMAGAEALCRWNNDGNIMPPIRFILILEQSQAICDLDFYMLEHVCMDIQRWIKEGKEVVKTSVNFSRRHMGNERLAERILEVIDKYEVPHEYIEIELTETTTDVEFRDLRIVVDNLQLQGVSTAVDDFGVGYSSLNLIRELPWDVLKIDKSFLPKSDDSSEKSLMFKYLIAMAQNLGLECIVEGVETLEQVRMLKENNCYMAQGFYFDKPLPVEEFETRLLALSE